MLDIITATLNGLLWLFGIGIVITVALFFYLKSKYKITVIYKDFTKGGIWVTEKAMSHMKVDDSVNVWKLEKTKKIILPVEDTIYHTEKGRPFGLFYRFDDDTFVPIKEEKKLQEIKENKDFVDSFDPFPTAHKSVYMQQIRNNQKWKKKGLSDMLKEAFPYVAIILLVALNLILLPDVLESKSVASDKAVEAGHAWEDAANAWDGVMNNKETIASDESAPNKKTDNNNNNEPPY